MLGGRAMPSRQLVWLLPLLVQTGESHQYIRGAATAVRPQTKASIGMESTPCMHSAFYFFTKQREISVRDELVHGELDAAHVLYGLIYGVHLGTSGPQKDMAVLMNLNNNGQAITLPKQLKDKGVTDGASLKKLVDSDKRDYTFAQTFPTGTHAMWLYYWLAANGIHPFNDVKTIVVPPPQMVANMRVGSMDGFCVGEPWNAREILY